MKSRLFLFGLLAALPILFAGTTITVGGTGGGTSVSIAQTVTVSASGGDATVICGFNGTTCSGSSAVELARNMVPSATNPVKIYIAPGYYNEIVALKDITDLTIINDGTIRPTVTTPTGQVDGGVFRIGPATTATRGADRITLINNGTIQDDAWSAPEAAVQVGPESCTGNAPTWGSITIINNGYIVGNHDGLQTCGEGRAGPNTTNLPTMRYGGAGWIIAGHDALTWKGNSIDYYEAPNILAQDNWCADTASTKNGVITGTVLANSGDTTTVNLQAADKYGATNGYAQRMLTLTGGGCTAAGKSPISAYNDTTGAATLIVPMPANITTSCTYTIAAIANIDETHCNFPWNQIAAASVSGFSWKQTGIHGGIDTIATAASALDSHSVVGGDIRVVTNLSSMASAPCTGQGQIDGILGGYVSGRFNKETFDNVNITMNLNADQQTSSCTRAFNGVAVPGAGDVTALRYSGRITMTNAADPELSSSAFNMSSSVTNVLTLGDVWTDINSTVGGYTGADRVLSHALANGIAVTGALSGPDLIQMNNPSSVTGWAEYCAPPLVGVGVVGLTGVPIPIDNGLVGAQIFQARCSCKGTCAAAETVSLTDGAGNAIGTLTCTDNETAPSWSDVSADADALLPAGELPEQSTGTLSGTATDDVIICLRYTTNRWVN